MDLPDFLTQDSLGEIRLAGHRVGLFSVIDRYNEGHPPEMIFCEFPSLPLALIHKVIAFYLENQAEVDAYVAEYRAEIERQAAAPRHGPDLDELRKRMEAMQQAETR